MFFTGAPRRRRRSIEQYNIVQESLRALAKRYGINQKTMAKWKNEPRLVACPPVQPNRSPRSCQVKMKRSSLPSGDTYFCRSSLHHACNSTASRGSRISRATSRPRRHSKPPRSVSSTSRSTRFRRGPQAISVCWYRSHLKVRFHPAR